MSTFLWYFTLWFVPLVVYAIILWCICTWTGRRVHFIEISDQDWCPKLFRQCVRNSLHYGWTFFGLTNYFGSPASTLSKIIEPYFKKLKCNLIIDLCSGSGGPTPDIHKILNKSNANCNTILTDLFPQISVWKYQCLTIKNLLFSSQSIDASSIQISKIPEISTIYHDEIHFRTLFGSFHHFKPKLAISILTNAMKCNDAFIMSEAVLKRGSIIDFIQWPFQLILLSPFFIILMVINNLFFYNADNLNVIHRIIQCILIIISCPIWVALFVHDAIISNARCYTEKELMELANIAKKTLQKGYKILGDENGIKRVNEYEWKCWRQNSDMIFPLNYLAPITVLLGVPKID